MKHINLQSVIEAYRNLESSLFQKLMNSYGIIVGGLNGIKDYELDGIEGLINNIFKHTAEHYGHQQLLSRLLNSSDRKRIRLTPFWQPTT